VLTGERRRGKSQAVKSAPHMLNLLLSVHASLEARTKRRGPSAIIGRPLGDPTPRFGELLKLQLIAWLFAL
jgi:hypothetical protein